MNELMNQNLLTSQIGARVVHWRRSPTSGPRFLDPNFHQIPASGALRNQTWE